MNIQGILGLIAGNGRFPFLILDAARAHGLSVVVAAIPRAIAASAKPTVPTAITM